jgi:hypothetical protein
LLGYAKSNGDYDNNGGFMDSNDRKPGTRENISLLTLVNQLSTLLYNRSADTTRNFYFRPLKEAANSSMAERLSEAFRKAGRRS